ncbi:MAG: STAS/SEC14 domain-containing protein [Methylobacter sp.]|nr:STAS/SEC14 domain-containing protein [Methylobacter sp.]
MPYQLVKTLDSESWIKLSGKLTVYDFQELQALAKSGLDHFGQVRILVELEGFEGWSRESGWEDSFFITEDGNRISKLAFVGDEKWKDEVFMFTGKEMRKTAIEFFPQEKLSEAKAWLSEQNSQSIFLGVG